MQNAQTLTSITGDSADFKFVYEDGIVTGVMARRNDGTNPQEDSLYEPYAHLSYTGNNYVKATSMDPASGYDYAEYFLNSDKLPLKITSILQVAHGMQLIFFITRKQTCWILYMIPMTVFISVVRILCIPVLI